MNLKSKLFGFAAASIFALSMTTGASAAISATSDVDVQLQKGVCNLELSSGTDISFNALKWNGMDAYVPTGATSTAITGFLYNEEPGGKCMVQVASDGLQINNAGIAIPLVLDPSSPMNTPPHTLTSNFLGASIPGGSWAGTLSLGTVPNTAPVGLYEGTVEFQIPNGA